MESIIKDFGIQPVLLTAQIVNFFVLLFLLKKFLYKPILKVLEDRRVRIEKSLKDAEKIEDRLLKLEAEREKVIGKANSEAQDIVSEATKSATLIITEAQSKANVEMEKILEKGKKDLSLERDKLHQEIREEISTLVVSGIQSVIGKVLTETDRKNLIKSSIVKIKN